MVRFPLKENDVVAFSQVIAGPRWFSTPSEVFDLVYKYQSFDLVYNAIQYAEKNDIDNLPEACEVLYKSKAVRG